MRDFIADFRGLSSTAKTKAICDGLSLTRRSLADVVTDPALVAGLLRRHEGGARPVKPKDLGVIGREHLLKRFIAAGAQEDSFDYQMNAFEHDGLPYVVEVAFAYAPGLAERAEAEAGRPEQARRRPKHGIEREAKGRDRVRRMVTGLNFSASVGANPFRELRDRQGLDGLLSAQYAGPDEPVIVFVHLTHAAPAIPRQGQILGGAAMSVAKTIADMLAKSTDRWAKQRKAEIRDANARFRRADRMSRRDAAAEPDGSRRAGDARRPT